MTWTPARVAQLCELYGSGLGSTKIARLLDVTRNSVIGRTDRLKRETAHWGKSQVDRMCDRIAAERDFDWIAERMGVSPEAVMARFAVVRRELGAQAV
jgi:hypothetical protein